MKKPDGLYLLFIVLVWLLILAASGSIFSGFHFMDDHMFFTITEKLKVNSFSEVLTELLQDDFRIRFRPLYWVLKLIEIKLLGVNLFYHSLFLLALVILTTSILFFSGMRYGLTRFQSFLISLLILVGYQSSIWWMLGPAETYGAFFLSLSTWSLVNYVKTGVSRHKFLFIVFLILSALTKESFLLLIPPLAIVVLYVDCVIQHRTLKQALKDNIFPLLLIFLFFSGSILFISISVGTHSIGYAGIDSVSGIEKYLVSIRFILLDKTVLLLIAGLLVFLIQNQFNREARSKSLILLSFLFILIVPQCILYAKSGFTQRYLQPSYFIIGIGVGIAVCLIHPPGDRLSKLFLFCIVLFLAARIGLNAYPTAREFAVEGFGNQLLFKTLQSQTQRGDTVLIVADVGIDFEPSISFREYIRSNFNMEATFYPVKSENKNLFGENLRSDFLKRYPRLVTNDLKSQTVKIIFPSVSKTSFVDRTTELNEPCMRKKVISDFIMILDSCKTRVSHPGS